MFKDLIQSQVIGTLKIYDKDSGDILVQKKNAIHPGNMAYVLASALAGKPTSVNIPTGDAPHINWMAFGNEGSVSATTLSYKSPNVFSTYDTLAITASLAKLYHKMYEQEITTITVAAPGGEMGGVPVPSNTAKVNYQVELSHADYALAVGDTIPANDGVDNDNFTFDEIGLLSGEPESGTVPPSLDEDKTLMLTHVTFHPVLLSANRTIVVDYTITIQIS
jgi:hypothetical protein